MIVRIMTDNQYRLGDERMAEVRRLDDALDAALDSGDEKTFQSTLHQLVDYVHANGQVIPVEEVIPSDVIIPAPDMTLQEAHARLHAAEVKPASGK